MGKVEAFILRQLYEKEVVHKLLIGFAQKVLTVLLAEAVSNTFYQLLLLAMDNDDEAHLLAARSVYAVLATICCPVAAVCLMRLHLASGFTFMGMTLSFYSKVCPVLIAWGWKDFAAQMDTMAGDNVWDELLIAVIMTVLVAVAQALPCYVRAQAGVAKGGESDTIFRRILTFPSTMVLALGYVWDTVVKWFVSHIEDGVVDLADDGRWEWIFFCQFVYTVCFGVFTVWVTIILTRKPKENGAAKDGEGGGPDGQKGETREQLQDVLHDWSGSMRGSYIHLIASILSFIYAWAVLGLVNSFGFGVMLYCSSATSCSYQNNFMFALVVTTFFTIGATLLHQCQMVMEPGGAGSTAIALQLNAQMLTVGWAWMNFYTTLMTYVTRNADPPVAVCFYILMLIVITVSTAVVNYVFQAANMAVAQHRKMMEDHFGEEAADDVER